MRRIIIALVALVGFAGFAEAHPRHHHHHHHRHLGYTHHHHRFHYRGYHRHHLRFRGRHHHHRYAYAFDPQPAAAPAWGPVAQPWGLGATGQTYPQAAPEAFARRPFRAAEGQPFVRPRTSLAGAGGGQLVRASWYGGGERLSSRTASGERFNRGGLTAAHRTLPFGTRVSVTNPQTGASVVVRINDRGPFVRGRSLDLARGAAQAIGLRSTGAVRMVVLN